jgi:hypothetical protein
MADAYGSSGESNIVEGSSTNSSSSRSTLDEKRTFATCIVVVVVVDTCIESNVSNDGSDGCRRGRGIRKLH